MPYAASISSLPNHSQPRDTMTMKNHTMSQWTKINRYLVFLIALLLTAPAVLMAQTAQTAGQPIISTTSTSVPSGTEATNAYIDAFVATGGATGGSDICTRINTAWATALPTGVNSATIDARAFVGTWTCSANPFQTTKGVNGVLLLGNVLIQTAVPWVIPSQVELRGIGAGQSVNTIIQASPGFPTSTPTPVLQMGPSGGPWFGIVIRDLRVDCANEIGCTGIFNNEAEENSLVDHVQIENAPAIGLHVSAYNSDTNPSNPAATNSGPYHNISIGFPACSNCSGATVGLQVDGPGITQPSGCTLGTKGCNNVSRVIREFNDITVSGSGVGHLTGAAVVIHGVSTAFTNSHIEFAQTGLAIGNLSSASSDSLCSSAGSDCITDGVEVSNVSIGTTAQDAGQIAVLVGNSGSGAPATLDVTLTGIVNQTVNTNSSTLQFNVPGGTTTTLSSANDPHIGLYAIGRCSGTSCTVVKNTQ